MDGRTFVSATLLAIGSLGVGFIVGQSTSQISSLVLRYTIGGLAFCSLVIAAYVWMPKVK